LEHVLLGNAYHLHDARHLVVLRVTREYGISNIQLCHDAAKGPHINGTVVRNPQHDLWCSVKSRLNVSVDALIKEGGAAEVDDFDARLVGFLEQDVLRLEVAVNDLEHLEVLEGVQELNCEPPYQVVIESIEVVDFEELEEVHAHEFKADAEMLAEDHVVVQVDHIHDVLGVVLFQILQNLELNPCLVVVLLLVLDHLHGHFAASFVVNALEGRSKTALAQEGLDLIPVANVVIVDYLVVTLVIVIPIVVFYLGTAVHLLSCLGPHKPDLLVLQNLLLLILSQQVGEEIEGFLGCQWELWHFKDFW
jgi:hypothetical protein